MNMPEAYIPQDIYTTLVTGAVVLVVLWLATFVVSEIDRRGFGGGSGSRGLDGLE